jgi:hypothetical protein
MSFTRNDLLKIYVPFVDVTGVVNGKGLRRVGRFHRREFGDEGLSPFKAIYWAGISVGA